MPEPDDTAHLLPPEASAEPRVRVDGRHRKAPDILRADIDVTRARMAQTLDRIEHRLARRRDELEAKATLRPVRRHLAREPWRTLALAFVAGTSLPPSSTEAARIRCHRHSAAYLNGVASALIGP